MKSFITVSEIARAANAPVIRAERRLAGLSPDGIVHSGKLKARVFLADRLHELVGVVNQPPAMGIHTAPAAHN
jgi:hypothetical protein